MAYRIYASHPLIELFGSFMDDEARGPRGFHCEGGPCGPTAPGRWRNHHGRHHQRCNDKAEGTKTEGCFVPAADVYSAENEYKVYISIPSAEKESIELTYDPNTRELTVSGVLVRPEQFAGLDEETLKKVLIQGERKVGKFERKLKIPKDEGEKIRFEEAVAKFENGVLELALPKVAKEGPKTLVIE